MAFRVPLVATLAVDLLKKEGTKKKDLLAVLFQRDTCDFRTC